MGESKTDIDETEKLLNTMQEEGNSGIAITGNKDVPLYGYLIAYTLGKLYIPHETAKGIWDARNIPVRPTSHSDALKKAITVFNEREYHHTEGTKRVITKYRIRLIAIEEQKDESFIYIYEISRHDARPDESSRGQVHRNIGRIMATKKKTRIVPESIEFSVLDQSDINTEVEAECRGIHQSIIELYSLLITNIDNDMIRDALLVHIKRHAGVPFAVGRGGAWFVPHVEKEFVQAIRNAIHDSKAFAKNVVDMRIVPVVKDDDLRLAIASDVARHVKQDWENLLKRTLKRLKTIDSEEKMEAIFNEAMEVKQQLQGLTTKYKDMLKMDIEIQLDTLQPQETTNPLLMSGRFETLMAELRRTD